MTRTALTFLILFLILVPAQAVIFNNLILFNVAMPVVFIYLIISLPMTLPVNWATTIGFVTGLAVDAFCDTPGVNALSSTTLAFVRRPVFRLYMSYDDDLSGLRPSITSMGAPAFFKYSLTMVFVYCALMFSVEAFQFFNLRLLVMRTIFSTVYSFILIYAFDSLSFRHSKSSSKRL